MKITYNNSKEMVKVMNLKDNIIDLLGRRNKALSIDEINQELNHHTREEFLALQDILTELTDNFEIYLSNKGRYMLFDRSPLKKGKMSITRKGYGFVDLIDEEDIFVASDNLNGAIHGDLVIAEVTGRKEGNKLEGRVLKILERDLKKIVGEFYLESGKGYIIPDEEKLKIKVEIDVEKIHGAVDGNKVVVLLLELIDDGFYSGEITEILGHKNDPGVDILSIARKYDIEDKFPEEVIEQLKSIPESVSEKDKEGRLDLTDEVIFTIDGADTKDIDDAISIEMLENGNYKLGVHIADVSHYIPENSPLDISAMSRGTSVYLVDRVIPMIPHQLSNGICSLNEGAQRLAISCMMEIDENAKLVDYDIKETVICSHKKMTYDGVNSILEDDIVPEGYEEYEEKLRLMADLAKVLRKNKLKRGYLDFDVDEAKIIVDENCHPIDIVLRERGVGENLIEDFMIVANECIASHIFYLDLPGIYRIHEYPKEEKIREFLAYIGTLGYSYKGNLKDVSPKTVQGILEFLKDKKEFKILSGLLLRNMKKAIYSTQNLGHYGLASKFYTHFTSPIRRYPDTTVHRLLKSYIFKADISQDNIQHWQEKLVFIAENSSARERASINCEREVDDMKMAEYMEDHIGEEFEGMISSVTNFGLFIQLDNLVEGLCRLADMDDFFHYNEKTLSVTGERSHVVYSMGDRVKVRVIAASKEAQTIDFKILRPKKNDKKKEEDVELL